MAYLDTIPQHLVDLFMCYIIEDYQCGFRHNRLITNYIFHITQITGGGGCNGKEHQLFTEFEEVDDYVRRMYAISSSNSIHQTTALLR